jgi:hypothetical protein
MYELVDNFSSRCVVLGMKKDNLGVAGQLHSYAQQVG